MYLETVNSPKDIKKLKIQELEKLAGEMRTDFAWHVLRFAQCVLFRLWSAEWSACYHAVFFHSFLSFLS